MSEFNSQSQVYDADASGLKTYVSKVFVNMAIALGVTTLVAVILGYPIYGTTSIVDRLFTQAPYLFMVLIVAEFGIAIAMGAGLSKFSTVTCRVLMFLYAAITGVTFAFLPELYGGQPVFEAFLFAAVLFTCMAVIGNYTRVDLTKFSGLFRGALLAFVILTILSLFIAPLRNNIVMGYIGLVLFLGLTAWDMQKIKAYYYQIGEGTIKENVAIYSAFQMYLDFINIFLYVLRILGNGRSRD